MKKPVYLLAGGRPKNPNEGNTALNSVFQECGISFPVIAYIGTANGDNPEFFNRMKQELLKAGAGEVNHAFTGTAEAADILERADMVFVSGGDVNAGMSRLRDSNVDRLLQTMFESGTTFFGISAGSIMLAERWVRWPDPEDADSAELFPCLGFAQVVCDCHDEDSGWEELQAALKLEKIHTFGYGLATGSGIRVAPDGTVKALGSAVHVLVREKGEIKRGPDLLPD